MSGLVASLLALLPVFVPMRGDAAVLRAAPPAGGDAVFSRVAPKVGQKVAITSTQEADLTVSAKMNGQEVNKSSMTNSQTMSFTATATSADAQAVTAAKLEFQKCEQSSKTDGGEMKQEHPCSSKTYQVQRKGAEVAVTGPDGKEVEEDEQTQLKDLAVLALEQTPLAATLAGKTMKEGEAVDVPEDAAAKVLCLFAEDAKVKSLKLTLGATRDEGGVDCAVFKVAASLGSPANQGMPAEMSIDLTGELLVSKAGCAVVAANCAGPIKLSGTKGAGLPGLEIEGAGKTSWKYSAKQP